MTKLPRERCSFPAPMCWLRASADLPRAALPVSSKAAAPRGGASRRPGRWCGRDQAAVPTIHQIKASYFFLPEAKLGCRAEVFWLGAAAITLIFSFLGFLASRLLLC